jgi:hypothetical protein
MLPTREKPIYQYLRTKNNRPIGLVAGCIENGVPLVGYSLCNEKDMWNRKRGRQIARGRFGTFTDIQKNLSKKFPCMHVQEVARFRLSHIFPLIQGMHYRLNSMLEKKDEC